MQLNKLKAKMDILCVDRVRLCKGLEITYNGIVESNGEINDTDEIVEIPEGVISLGRGVFKYMNSLKEVRLPDSLTKISESVFSYGRLTRLAIPRNVEAIMSNCFTDCNIKEVEFAEDSVLRTIRGYTFNNARIGKLILPRGYNIIDQSAFAISEIDTVIFNAGSIIVREKAFSNSCIRIVTCDSIEIVEYHAFANCTELKSIDLTKTEFIGAYAFNQCKMLRKLDLRKCKFIGACAFGNTTLDIVIMGYQIKIEEDAFQNSKIKRLISNGEVYNQLTKEAEILDWIDVKVLLD